jgi:hypothetical protein
MYEFLEREANTWDFNCEIMISQKLNRHSQRELFTQIKYCC